jgi:2-iminobutanoate/2-iminopropanoate deaminase
MVGLDPASGDLVAGGAGAETSRILHNLALAATDFGVNLDELLVARIYTARFDEFDAINAVWSEVFGRQDVPPARTAVGVSALPLGAAVEIDFSFVAPST